MEDGLAAVAAVEHVIPHAANRRLAVLGMPRS
jgi:hypothetical protein